MFNHIAHKSDMTQESLKHKVIVITGAGGGIGSETSRLLASLGATCILANRPGHRFTTLVNETRQVNPKGLMVEADLALWKSWPHLITRTIDTFGRIDALVHCVGSLVPQSLDAIDEEQLRRVIDANLVSAIHGIKAVLPVMKRQKGGHIIVVGSLGGILPMPYQALYSATKFAVRGLCLSLSEELRRVGIWVSVIEPGPVRTRMLFEESNDRRATIAFSSPPLQPNLVASAIVDVLLSPKAEVILPQRNARLARLIGLFPGLFTIIRPLLSYFGNRRIREFRKVTRNANNPPAME